MIYQIIVPESVSKATKEAVKIVNDNAIDKIKDNATENKK